MGGANFSHFPDNVRVASVQYLQGQIRAFDDFSKQLEHWISTAAEQQADFVVLPERFTLQLLSLSPRKPSSGEALAILNHYTFKIEKSLRRFASKYRINVIGGSHLISRPNGQVENVCLIALRDGSLHHRAKIHIPEAESRTWSTCSGDAADALETDCGTIGILLGQDVESPELARRLVNQGAGLLFTPHCTALREHYLRLRHAAQARALENPAYVILSGNVGYLQGVSGMGSQYAQNVVLSACDFSHSHDGVVSEGAANTEMLLVADLQPEILCQTHTRSARPTWSRELTPPADLFTARPRYKRLNPQHLGVAPSPAPVAPAYNVPMPASNRSYS